MSVVLERRHRLLHMRALLARWNGREQEIRQVHTRSPLDSQLLHQEKGDPTGTVTGRSWGITSTSPRKNMIDIGRNEEICREMDKLANEDHTHRITEEEIRVYRNNWWIRSNIVSSDTMPVRHRADFKQALTTLPQLKNQEDTAYYQKWQSSSSSWWNWQESWWHSSSEHHRDDGPNTDRTVKLDRR